VISVNVAILIRMVSVTFAPLVIGASIVKRVPAVPVQELVPVTVFVHQVYLATVHVLAMSTKRPHGCYRIIFHAIWEIAMSVNISKMW
jgi:hypothetical protein